VSEKIRAFIIVFFLIIIFSFLVESYDIKDMNFIRAKEIYIENSIRDTNSLNTVTSIYLDYRLFDSVFEALVLLITTSAVAFIIRD
jgi:multicomponent Na+:H+ antiporter subunit B